MKRILPFLVMTSCAMTLFSLSGQAQTATNAAVQSDASHERCGHVAHQNYLRSIDPKYDRKVSMMNQQIQNWIDNHDPLTEAGALMTIPLVVHVVYNGAGEYVNNTQVQNMVTALNDDFRRTNADAVNTPTTWQGIASDTEIEFCLAQRDPLNNPTNGIVEVTTSTGSFSTNDNVKFTASGGSDAWDTQQYFNIWICDLSSGLLGYGQFPPPVNNTYGAVVDYCTVKGTCPPFALNRTATHELGHCWSLYHIWGDDGGACSGSDLVGDTPNQADATNGCPSYPATDACATASPGYMFMNYMDYSNDNCMNMFTQGQRTRARSSINANNASLLTSLGCTPLSTDDAGISAIFTPQGTVCSTTLTPQVELSNYGNNTLTSVDIDYYIDANPPTTFAWTGSLATGNSTTVTLGSMTTTAGAHTFTATTNNPNGNTDGFTGNDTQVENFTVSTAGVPPPFFEGFESATFPPTGWTINNPDGSVTWDRSTNAASTGSASMYMDNWDYPVNGELDEITMEALDLNGGGTVTMTFDVAYALYSATGFSDTLRVFVSDDCGATWTMEYEKFDAALTTVPNVVTVEYVPGPNDWRTETIDLTPYNSFSNVLIKFYHGSDYENNLHIDDINITSTGGTPPVAAFTSNSTGVCAGNSINFTDQSTNSPTSWNWTFSGGTPSSSTNQNPTITYNTPGTYNVSLTATNANGSDVTTQNNYITVYANPTATTSTVDVTCNGSGDGSATITASSGTAPYTYAWSSGGNGATENNLGPGTYNYTVTDANGCTTTGSAIITEPAAIVANGASVNSSCGNSDGSASVSPTGGNAPYTYNWSSGGSSATETGLAAGAYACTITDANGCQVVENLSVSDNGAGTLSTTQTDLVCNGDTDGDATATISGGTPPYTYNWSTGGTTATITGLVAGTYTVTVNDANGCQATATVIITEPSALVVNPTATTSSGCTGTANANASGGTAPYTYLWNDPGAQTTATATALCAGTYNVTVTDANGCTTTAQANVVATGIWEPTELTNINLFPNPTSGQLNLEIELSRAQDVSVRLLNSMGQIVDVIADSQVSSKRYTLDMSPHAKGVYYVTLTTEKETITKKVTVIR